VDGAYYCNVVLCKHLLPAICCFAVDCYTVKQDSALAHHTCDTVELFCRETPDFTAPNLWPPYSLDVNRVDYLILGCCKTKCTSSTFKMSMSCGDASLTGGQTCSRLCMHSFDHITTSRLKPHIKLTMQLMSGVLGLGRVFGPEVDTLNICCSIMLCSCWFMFFSFWCFICIFMFKKLAVMMAYVVGMRLSFNFVNV